MQPDIAAPLTMTPDDLLEVRDPMILLTSPAALQDLAARAADRVLRTDFAAPGFALLELGPDLTPRDFRQVLTELCASLDRVYQQRFEGHLLPRSMGRFSQQVSTEPHLDGAPEESVLVLGYEPTPVASRVFLLDYSRCAADQGMDPKPFLDRFNPTFGGGAGALRDYTTELTAFSPPHFQVLVINNSSAPYSRRHRGMLGVLHHSIIPNPQPAESRHVNTLLLSTAPLAAAPAISPEDIRDFVESATFKTG